MQAQTTPLDPELRQEKNIAVCVILSFVTFGIYLLIWLYGICKKIKLLSGEPGGVVGEYLLLLFIPFYGWYWVYTRGKKLSASMERYGVSAGSDNAVLYLILNIVGLSIVTYALMQNELNKVAAQAA